MQSMSDLHRTASVCSLVFSGSAKKYLKPQRATVKSSNIESHALTICWKTVFHILMSYFQCCLSNRVFSWHILMDKAQIAWTLLSFRIQRPWSKQQISCHFSGNAQQSTLLLKMPNTVANIMSGNLLSKLWSLNPEA